MPRVSAVIPAHQAAAFIAASLGSVLAQTYADLEVVVVDNGSTDGTGDVVAGFGDPRVSYVWQEDSGLPGDSRNVGVVMAAGELVAFLDADDSWDPHKLERVIAAFDGPRKPDVVCHAVRVLRDGEEEGVRGYALEPGEDVARRLLYTGNPLTTSAVTVRRTLVERLGGFSERRDFVTVEDYDLWIRMAEAGARFSLLPDVLGSYLVHASSASANLRRHYDNAVTMLDTHFERLAAEGRLDARRATARVARARYSESRDLARGGAVGEALGIAARTPGELAEKRRRYARAWRGQTES